jgi:hypothetical protein
VLVPVVAGVLPGKDMEMHHRAGQHRGILIHPSGEYAGAWRQTHNEGSAYEETPAGVTAGADAGSCMIAGTGVGDVLLKNE